MRAASLDGATEVIPNWSGRVLCGVVAGGTVEDDGGVDVREGWVRMLVWLGVLLVVLLLVFWLLKGQLHR